MVIIMLNINITIVIIIIIIRSTLVVMEVFHLMDHQDYSELC